MCGRFTTTLAAADRCEPCAGVQPLDWTAATTAATERSSGPARVCVETGEHEFTSTQPCDCGADHPLPICVRCLHLDTAQCEVSS